MKVLLISNQHPNMLGIGNPIMCRMKNALENDKRIEKVEFLPFYNKLSSFFQIRKMAKYYDIIHVHFGGLYALLIWITLIGINARKFITFHGTDIHAKLLKTAKGWKRRFKIRINQKASFLSIVLFDRCGFVAKEMYNYVPSFLNNQMQKKAFYNPLGVDYSTFIPVEKSVAQQYLGLVPGKYVLFSDVSNTSIKRRDIAKAIVKELGTRFELLIMCEVKPQEVPYYINSCEFLILTSDEEGSPNIVREALVLNKPVFSVNVGDVAKQLSGLNNSCIISRNPMVACKTILEYFKRPYTDNTRETLRHKLDFVEVNREVVSLYCK